MANSISNIFSKSCFRSLEEKFLTLSVTCRVTQIREAHLNRLPRLRNPTWFTKKVKSRTDEQITPENKEFVKEVVQDVYNKKVPLQKDLITNVEWTPKLQRTGVIARKIGVYPLWLKDGKKISTTLLQGFFIYLGHRIRNYTEAKPDRFKGCVKTMDYLKDCFDLKRENLYTF